MTEHMTVRNFRKWTSLEARATAFVEGRNDVVILACVKDKNTHQPRFIHWGTPCLREAVLDHLPAIIDGFHAKRMTEERGNLEGARVVGEEDETATPDLPDLWKEPCGLAVMNIEGLRALVRTAIRMTTKREPRWGKDEARWEFWDDDVPYTLSVDPRTAEQKRRQSWASFLRETIRRCYQHYGLEHRLADDQPSDTAAADQPSDTAAADQPSDTAAADQPSDTAASDQPSDTAASDQPSDTAASDQPSDTAASDQPSDTAASDQPSDTAASDQPSDTAAADQPSDTAAADQPSDTAAADQPSSSESVPPVKRKIMRLLRGSKRRQPGNPNGPTDQASNRPTDQASNGPAEQASNGPTDQASNGPAEQASNGPAEQASNGPAEQASNVRQPRGRGRKRRTTETAPPEETRRPERPPRTRSQPSRFDLYIVN
ncbi:GTPase regulator Nrf1 [Branchiostoma belcheri]|nr:GTPase regulator Nrf1 [Branchiostoma belcheri]